MISKNQLIKVKKRMERLNPKSQPTKIKMVTMNYKSPPIKIKEKMVKLNLKS